MLQSSLMEYDYKVFGKTIHILPVCEFHHTAQQFGCSGRTGDTALSFSHICRGSTESLARDRDRNTQYLKITSGPIALQFGTLAKPSKRIALLVYNLVVLPRVRCLFGRAIKIRETLALKPYGVGFEKQHEYAVKERDRSVRPQQRNH